LFLPRPPPGSTLFPYTTLFRSGRRQKARSTSRLEDIPGIGPRRRASLLKHFGGLGGLRAAGVAEIARVEGVNLALAERIYATLHGLDAPAPAATRPQKDP